ncbi:segregation and condensation protein B [Halobacillus andaensis]|uniref:Segregation and condensation protein B n=1 Tax=Halobacillus andaensis TaxID=1176239 RepID=A0A917AY87_HALAA|nr:SMC-Scp complex subunit ScpB [Halobacillus andaensis]MBP2003221.1 segregation and condensation protein B [Halobacillus andaensis]GGF08967.1 segregation and condensation protein B [Halobacillus andaensis]
MNNDERKALIEGLLFASGEEGVSKNKLTQIMDCTLRTLNELLESLYKDYESPGRGIKIMESNGTLHLTTKPEHAAYYEQLLNTKGSTRLSQASLEVLAIIAYRQPITRIEIDELRGVKSDRAVQTLVNRGLIEERGRKEAVGRPVLFGTSTAFLTYFGLSSIEELPPIEEFREDENVEDEADLFFENFSDEES